MKRPLLIAALPYVTGILLAWQIPLPLPWLLLSSLMLTLLALAWRRGRAPLLYLVLLLAGWTNFILHTTPLSPNDLRCLVGTEPQIVTVRGQLPETPTLRFYEQDEREPWRTMAQVRVSALRPNNGNWRPAAGLLAVSTPGMLTNLFAGQIVEITGVAGPPNLAAAPGTFDYRAYLQNLGIYCLLRTTSERDWEIVASPSRPPLADRFRAWARDALRIGLPADDESLQLEWALTLGWKAALTEQVSEPFVQAATYHIFAVDGLRMAIIFGIFFTVFRAFGLPRAVGGLLLLPLLWFYVALTGWPASAIRATVMLSVIIVGWALKRPSDLINSLLAAAFIILTWQPQQIFQAGFQLSFFVVLCLILMLPPLFDLVHRATAPDPLLPEQLHRRWPAFVLVPARYVTDILLTSFAAWVGSLPLAAYYFNILTPVSTPANLVAVPLCGLVLSSNLSSLLLAGWFPAAAALFNHAGWFVMECIRATSHWFARWPAAYFYVPAPSLFTTMLYYSVLLALLSGWLLKPAWRAAKFAALALALFVWGANAWNEHSVTRLTVLPAHGGSAIYFDAPGRKNDLLIDSGTTNSVQFILKTFLRAQGVNRLPVLLLTHGDLHHVGGAEMVADLFSVEQVCASPMRFRSPAYRKIIAHFRDTPGLVRTLSRSDRCGPWTVLHPEKDDHFSVADDSAVVLDATFKGTRVLLLSDLGRPGQDALLERATDLRADILVTGLPSAGEAIADAFLDAVQPRVIIVADMEFPVSERARTQLCTRLAQRGVPVIYTRSAGATTVEFRGSDWEIRTMTGTKLRSRTATARAQPGPGRAGDGSSPAPEPAVAADEPSPAP